MKSGVRSVLVESDYFLSHPCELYSSIASVAVSHFLGDIVHAFP